MADRTLYEIALQIGGRVNSSLGNSFRNANSRLSQMQRHANLVNNSMRGMGSAITGALGGLALGAIGLNAVKNAAQFEQYNVAFDTLLRSHEKATKLMGEITKFAAATPFEMPELVAGTKRLVAFGVEANVVVNRLGRLGDLSMGKAEILERLTLAYGKIKAKGKASLEELNQLTEAGVPIMSKLAQMQKVSTSALFKMVSKGKIGYKEVEKAVMSLTDKGGQFYLMTLKQSKTLNGIWSTLVDSFNIMGGTIAQRFLPQIKRAVTKLINMIPGIQNSITSMLDNILKSGMFSKIASKFSQVFASISPSINELANLLFNDVFPTLKVWILNTANVLIPVLSTAITTVFPKLVDGLKLVWGTLKWIVDNNYLVIGAITGIASAVAISAISSGVALGAITGAYYSLSWALASCAIDAWAFTAALLANPLTWVAIGIAAVVAGSIWLYQNWDLVCKKASELWKWIIKQYDAFTSWLGPMSLANQATALLSKGWESVTNACKGAWEWLKKVTGFGDKNIKVKMDIQKTAENVSKTKTPPPSTQKAARNASKIPMLAKGTNSALGGLSIVGEKGPELADLQRGGRVIPAHRTQKTLESLKGSNSNMVFNFSAPITINGNADPKIIKQSIRESLTEFESKYIAVKAKHKRLGIA